VYIDGIHSPLLQDKCGMKSIPRDSLLELLDYFKREA
jgi:hypothetical protein